MKAWQLEHCGKQNLHLVDRDRPTPGPGEVLIRTDAVSLNYRDKAIIDGTYPLPMKFPMILGSDVAGEVVAVGEQVSRLKVGDRVVSVYKPLWVDGVPTPEAWNANLGGPLAGVLAEDVVLPETGALTYAGYLTPGEASTLPVAAVTAWVGLFATGQLQAGQTVLVQGSGGVALAALQLAVAQGARVIALSRSPEKAERLKELGASEVIDTNKMPEWDAEVRRLTGGAGVDHVVEVLGGDQLQRSIAACAWNGHVAVIGFMNRQESKISIPAVLGGAVRIQGVGVGSQKDMRDLLQFLQTHPIRPVIDSTYDFAEVPDALDDLDRGPFGKVVVEVRR